MWAVKEVLNHVLLKIVFKNSYQTTLTFEFHCSTELGCHFLLQGIFLTQELTQLSLHWQVDSLWLLGKPIEQGTIFNILYNL